MHELEATVVEPTVPPVLAETLRAGSFELVLLDLDLGEHGDSTPLVAELTAAGVRVVVVSGTEDIARIVRVLDEGAYAFCPKTIGFDALTARIVTALHSDVPLDDELRRRLGVELARRDAERRARCDRFDRLTEREQTTLRELSRGLSVRDIARTWVVSEATVRTHVRGVLTKLDVTSQLAAVAAAFATEWLSQTP